VKYSFETASGGMMYIRLCMTIASSTEVMLTLLPQQRERLQCWYY
jgi:hypothetical protein